MEEMRWILLMLGGLLVLGIYLFGVWNKSDVYSDRQTNERVEPSIINLDENSNQSETSEDESEKYSQKLMIDPEFEELEPEKQFVVTVRLVAINNSRSV